MNKHTRLIIACCTLGFFCFGTRAQSNELRLSTLGNSGIALYDESNQINLYDFGRNPAFLLMDYYGEWIRFSFGIEEESGELRRSYDPLFINNLYAGFSGIKKLGEQHVVKGHFRYGRLYQKEISRSLELDQYNDPFYLTDLTVGDFEYFGPSMQFDYAVRLAPKIHIGAGLDYDISTGLKQRYTRPEIVHNLIRGNIGVVYQAKQNWLIGVVARPLRLQNRTEFEKTDEGFDNIIHRFYGDGIFDIRSFSSNTIREVMYGVEFGFQNFIDTDRFKVGALFTYNMSQNKIRYGSSRRELRGFWQNIVYDAQILSRYQPDKIPLILGFKGRYMSDDGWAKRPEFDDILLYENPLELWSVGTGVSYRILPLNLLASLEYVMNNYDVEAVDYGANAFRSEDIVQNIGRLGLEHALFGLHSIRAGVEVTDCLIDRWLKLPGNIDRYRFTGGLRYRTGFWDIDVHLMYSKSTKESVDSERKALSGIVWFTHSLK